MACVGEKQQEGQAEEDFFHGSEDGVVSRHIDKAISKKTSVSNQLSTFFRMRHGKLVSPRVPARVRWFDMAGLRG